MQLNIVIQHTVQRASQETCDKVGKPYGTIEVLDFYGDRVCFASTMLEACDQLVEIWDTSLGGTGYSIHEVADPDPQVKALEDAGLIEPAESYSGAPGTLPRGRG